MPHVGLEPACVDPLTHTITKLTKRFAGKATPQFLQTQNGTGGLEIMEFRNPQKIKD